jgi:hypothetical protein
MKYVFNSRFVLEAKNSVEAWDLYLKHLIIDQGINFQEAIKLTKVFEIKEIKQRKKQSRSSAKFEKPFDFRSKWK